MISIRLFDFDESIHSGDNNIYLTMADKALLFVVSK